MLSRRQEGRKNGASDTALLELRLPSNPKDVPEARRQAMRACARLGLSEDGCAALDLALGEALANAVVHGVPRQPQSDESEECPISVSLWDYQGSLVVEVADRGQGFAPPLPPYPMPPAGAEATHGRGLPLMEMLTDAFMVCRGDAAVGGAAIYLVKTLPSPSC